MRIGYLINKTFGILTMALSMSSILYAAEVIDESSFELLFRKRGECEIGFYNPDISIDPSATDAEKAEEYAASLPPKDKKVFFNLGDSSAGIAKASAKIGVYWYLFSESTEDENYKISMIFTADATETINSLIDNAMLSLTNENGTHYLNYKVSVDDNEMLRPGENENFTKLPQDRRKLEFTENNVSSGGELGAKTITLEISAPYGTETEDGVALGTYSGHIIMKLERV